MNCLKGLGSVAVFMLLILSAAAFAQGETRTFAVMDFDVSSSQYASFGKKVAKYIRESLNEEENTIAFSEKELKSLAKKHDFEMTFSDADSAAAALGEAIGADYLVMGFAVKLGKKYKITARILQVATAQSEIVKGEDLEDKKDYHREFAGQITETSNLFVRTQADKSYQIALQYLQAEDYDDAINNFEAAVEIDPNYGDAWVGLVACYYAMEAYDDAMTLVDKTMEIDPSIGQAYYYKAALLQREDRCEEALPFFDRAVQADSTYHPAFYNWAQCLRMIGETDQAVEKMEAAIEIEDNPGYRSALARIFEDQYDVGRAFKVYYDVVMEDSTQNYAWGRIVTSGSDYLVMGSFDAQGVDELGFSRDKIVDIVRKGIENVIAEHGPNVASIYDILGNALFDIGEYERSLEIYKEWEKLEPTSLEPIARQVKVLNVLNRASEAIDRLKQMVNRAPENWNAKVALSIAYMDLNNISQAKRYAREAMGQAPGETSSHHGHRRTQRT